MAELDGNRQPRHHDPRTVIHMKNTMNCNLDDLSSTRSPTEAKHHTPFSGSGFRLPGGRALLWSYSVLNHPNNALTSSPRRVCFMASMFCLVLMLAGSMMLWPDTGMCSDMDECLLEPSALPNRHKRAARWTKIYEDIGKHICAPILKPVNRIPQFLLCLPPSLKIAFWLCSDGSAAKENRTMQT